MPRNPMDAATKRNLAASAGVSAYVGPINYIHTYIYIYIYIYTYIHTYTHTHTRVTYVTLSYS